MRNRGISFSSRRVIWTISTSGRLLHCAIEAGKSMGSSGIRKLTQRRKAKGGAKAEDL